MSDFYDLASSARAHDDIARAHRILAEPEQEAIPLLGLVAVLIGTVVIYLLLGWVSRL